MCRKAKSKGKKLEIEIRHIKGPVTDVLASTPSSSDVIKNFRDILL